MRYETLLNMGFTRDDQFSGDKQFFNEHGYKCFWLEYILIKQGKCLYIHWYPDGGKMELIHHSKGTILSRREIIAKEMHTLITTFKREGDIPVLTPQMFA